MEAPKALPLSNKDSITEIDSKSDASNVKPADAIAELNSGGEIWKDANDHEVDILSRNVRGAKNNNGAGGSDSSGKKDNKKKNKKIKNHDSVVDVVGESETQVKSHKDNIKSNTHDSVVVVDGTETQIKPKKLMHSEIKDKKKNKYKNEQILDEHDQCKF